MWDEFLADKHVFFLEATPLGLPHQCRAYCTETVLPMQTNIKSSTNAYTHTYTHTYKHSNIHAYMHTYVHTYMHVPRPFYRFRVCVWLCACKTDTQTLPVRLVVPSYDSGCTTPRRIRKSAKLKLNPTRSSPEGP